MKNLEHIIEIGAMDEVLEILEPIKTTNDFGEVEITYQLADTVMGEFLFKSSKENMNADQVTGVPTATVNMRYYPGLTHLHRIVRKLDQTDWNITGITDAGRLRFHRLTLETTE